MFSLTQKSTPTQVLYALASWILMMMGLETPTSVPAAPNTIFNGRYLRCPHPWDLRGVRLSDIYEELKQENSSFNFSIIIHIIDIGSSPN